MKEENATFSRQLQLCVNIPLFIFVLLLLYFNETNFYAPAILQLCFVSLVLICFNIGICIQCRLRTTLVIIFFFQIVSLMLINVLNLMDNPPDGIFYRFIGRTVYYDGLDIIYNHTLDYADWGYSFIVGLFYAIVGYEYAPILLCLFNIVVHLLTCAILYSILTDLFSEKVAQKISLLWGLNLGAVYWNSAFLKESIFCFIVSMATYGLYKFCTGTRSRNNIYLLIFIIFTVLSAFFRTVVPIFLFSSICAYYIFKRLPSLYFAIFIIGILLSTYFATDLVVQFFPEAEGGFTQREQSYGSGILSFLNIINPFICPYPAISLANNQVANLQVAVFASYNIVFAYFIIMGIWTCLRKRVHKLYPIVILLMLNSIMLIAYGFSMNYRYIYVVSPLAYLFIPYGIVHINKKYLFIPYLIAVFLITIFYNSR